MPNTPQFINVKFLGNSLRQYPVGITPAAILNTLSTSLLKSTIACKNYDSLIDLQQPLTSDAQISFLSPQQPDGLDVLRHSTAHLLACAVQALFPAAKVATGPTTEHGFFYDFSYHRPFDLTDLAQIEAKMHELASKAEPILRQELSSEAASILFEEREETFKQEILQSIPSDQTITLYTMGAFTDLCRGPHAPHTGWLKHFQLTKVSGAYWKGNKENPMLQRITGVAFASKAELQAHQTLQEEAAKRDHRRLGKDLNLFHLDELSPGTVFWHPKGWTLWQTVEQYMRQIYRDNGYLEIKTPQIIDKSLWEKTGHWDKYRDNMFTTDSEKREYALKPMNCPAHILVFNQGVKSYRDLPLRYGEFGQCHRNEPTGGLHGIMRVRGFTQDDGHIFCTEDQIQTECDTFTSLLQNVYAKFGFTEILYKVATRPAKRIGSDALWDKAEQALFSSLQRTGCDFEVSPGDGAFYGPKIEYTLKDALGRHWQCGTIQVDFSLPERLDATFVSESGERQHPVMLHRAILGSMERFIGILIEQHAGALPFWLSPTQVVVLPITDAHAAYAQLVVDNLIKLGVRATTDSRNEKVNKKIREHSLQKIPTLLIVGDNEMSQHTVSVRNYGSASTHSLPLDQLSLTFSPMLTP